MKQAITMAPPLPRTSSFFHLLFFSCLLLAAATKSSDAAGAPQLQAMNCSTEGNYTSTDAYAANLNQLLAALPANTVSNNGGGGGGFFNGTAGEGAATVYGLAMCSADFSRPDCADCLTAASSNGTGLAKRCPGSVTASIMFDQCMIRYSNRNFFGTAQTGIVFTSTLLGARSWVLNEESLKQGISYLGAQAALSPERFAASATYPYALVQCTWDLPPDKCTACIDALSANATNQFDVGIHGECKTYSCRLRYSNASFTVVPLVAAAAGTGPSSADTNTDRISNKFILAGAVTVTIVVVGTIALLFCLVRKHHLSHHRLRKEAETGIISAEFLLQITNNFSNEGKNILGEGAFGQVYKGVLYGKEIAAVKRLSSRSFQDEEAFKRELNNLMKLKHPNIVELIGYCYETKRKLVENEDEAHMFESEIYSAIVFEYMHNGSLQKYIHDESNGLNWKARYKIIKGTCEGLRYLHKPLGKRNPMLHLDLKPGNILLTKNMVPKLADFGLSKLVNDDNKEDKSRPFGTRGYMPPEYNEGKDASEKFDIFSLGVVMMEIISGPEAYKKKVQMRSSQAFIDYVEANWRKRLPERHTTLIYLDQVKRCVKIAIDCVNHDPMQRPSIEDIISRLNKDTEHDMAK